MDDLPPSVEQAADPGEDHVADDVSAQVVVESSRTGSTAQTLPLAVTIGEPDPLDPRGPGLSLAEQVVTVPGLIVRDRYNAAQGPRIAIRGFGARSSFGVRGVTVVLDGIPLTLADGLAQVDLVDPDLIGRIEVLRGPAGALYGNAAGGVLLLDTAGGEARTGEYAVVRVGEYGLREVVARAAEVVPAGSLVIAASGTTWDGYREHSRSERWIVHGSSRLEVGGAEVRLVATVLDAPVADDPGGLTRRELRQNPAQASPTNLEFDAGEDVTQLQVGGLVRMAVTPSEVLELSAYHVGRSFVGRIPFRYNELARDAYGGSAQARSARSVLGLPVRATAAVEAAGLNDRRLGFDSDGGQPTGGPTLHQDDRVLALGTFGQLQADLVPWLTAVGGARYDRQIYALQDRLLDDGDASDRRDFGALTGLAGVVVTPIEPLLVYANVADAYETPTISELSLRPNGEAGFVDSLDPQRARNAEVGARAAHGPVRGDAALFHTWLRDELVPFEDETGRTYYRNAGRSHRSGVELSAAAALPLELELGVAYALLVARFDEYTVGGEDLAGRTVPGIPPHHVGASATWGAGDGPFGAADLEWLSAVYADDANRSQAPSQAVVGARMGYRGRFERFRFEARVGVENLLDVEVVDNLRVNASEERLYEPGWPRFFHGGITVGVDRTR